MKPPNFGSFCDVIELVSTQTKMGFFRNSYEVTNFLQCFLQEPLGELTIIKYMVIVFGLIITYEAFASYYCTASLSQVRIGKFFHLRRHMKKETFGIEHAQMPIAYISFSLCGLVVLMMLLNVGPSPHPFHLTSLFAR